MDVMPVASKGEGQNKNNDYDEADVLKPFVRCGSFYWFPAG
jgi:hypothetical protein